MDTALKRVIPTRKTSARRPRSEPCSDIHTAAVSDDRQLLEPLLLLHRGPEQGDNVTTSRQDRQRDDDEGNGDNSNPASNGNPIPSGDESVSVKNMTSWIEEESDLELDPSCGPSSEPDSEKAACPNCVRLAVSVAQYFNEKKEFLVSNDGECCKQNVEQCIRLVQLTRHPSALRADRVLDLEPWTTATLYHIKTGCSACRELATSVAYFHQMAEDCDLREHESCKKVVYESIVLLQQTGRLVTIRSSYLAKMKRKGARWHEIRNRQLRKMNHQLSLADPFHHKCPVGRILEQEPGLPGGLSRRRPFKPLLLNLNDIRARAQNVVLQTPFLSSRSTRGRPPRGRNASWKGEVMVMGLVQRLLGERARIAGVIGRAEQGQLYYANSSKRKRQASN